MPLGQFQHSIMTLKNIWTFNFGTTVLLLVLLLWKLLSGMYLEKSDKDIILIFAVFATGLYLGLLIYSFYNRIFKLDAGNKKAFYLLTLPMVIANLIFLFRLVVDNDLGRTVWLTLIPLVCGLNILTYFWGLLTKGSVA